MNPRHAAMLRHSGPRGLRAGIAMLAAAAVAAVGLVSTGTATAAPPVGQGFTVTPADLDYILKQIKIAEHHANNTTSTTGPCGALVGNGANQIPSPLLSFGLRTVDGSCNNLQSGQERFGSSDQTFPRLTTPEFSPAEPITDALPVGPPGPTSYAQTDGSVIDSEPRTISNLIVDQTSTNPAAVAAAGFPVRTQGNEGVVPCTTEPTTPGGTDGLPAGCVPANQTLFIPNVTTDVGLSPPFNGLFTIFGQFFDHGLDKITNGGAGTVFVPLKADDPLVTRGPDGIAGNGDEVPPGRRLMTLTRGSIVTGPDGERNSPNTDTPFVDQSQTYTSHASHQFFLREYTAATPGAQPKATGRFLDKTGDPNGIATWGDIKTQARDVLGIELKDVDVHDIPMVVTDPYGNYIPGPARGMPQYVIDPVAQTSVEGDVNNPVQTDQLFKIGTAFLNDIAHSAEPGTPATPRTPDSVPGAGGSLDPVAPGEYDDELLDLHAICGDGRCNENIALQAIHQVFHSEHNRLVQAIDTTLTANQSLGDAYKAVDLVEGPNRTFTYQERLFQAARFVTEMQYQHLVFEEFARKVQPAINPFEAFAFNQTDVDPAITAEFAHAVYRFGHSMLTEDIARKATDGSSYDIPLLDGFLNPAEYYKGKNGVTVDAKTSATAIIMGMSDQTGNEIDEFVTNVLRNNLLGLPLDLAAINMTRARSEGIPPLNEVRRQINAATNDGQLAPYTNWVDFGQALKHPESLTNFVAAYGTHSAVTSQTTLAGKRTAAQRIVEGLVLPGLDGKVADDPDTAADETLDNINPPADSADFMFGTGSWQNASGKTTTGLDRVDLWVGGLAENTNPFGGLLGTTFNYVFEKQLTDLQNGDRFYYLARTPGMNLRAQLEGNSFAELMMRNSEATTLKADPFATADCKFELTNLSASGSSGGGDRLTGPGTVHDDLASECDENELLLRQSDGTIEYRSRNAVDPAGINGQAVYNGTTGVDRIKGGNDNDTFWGGEDRDWIDGGAGDDIVLGGEGNDIITDAGGADIPKGGPGNDAIDGGIGDDIVMGGDGNDFTNGGANLNEHFLGEGNDFAIAGQGTDAVFGDGGDDWAEGGDQPDLLIGDSSTLFFDDHNKPGHDVLIGQGGDDDYDMEGGDDIGVGGPGVEKNAGASGWDWLIGQNDPQAQFADLALPILNAPPANETRDRFNEVEALSGWKFDDQLLGDDIVPSELGGGGFIGCDALDQAGLDRIAGLDDIVPPLDATNGVPTADVVNASVTNYCMLTGGFVWGQGDILLGGEGSDTLTGRGADDILDGDRWVRVRISHRTNPAVAGTETGWTDLMENKAVSGNFGPGTTGMTLQQAVFAGLVDPGNLVVVREVITPTAPPADCGTATPVNCDTAVFLGPRSAYVLTTAGDGTVTVNQTGPVDRTLQKVTDGIDTVRNVEQLKFANDEIVSVGPAAALTPAPGLAFGDQRLNITSPTLLATVTNTGTAPVTLTGASLGGTDAGLFSLPEPVGCTNVTLQVGLSCTVTVDFTPTSLGAKSATLTVTRSTGPALTVPLTGNGVVAATAPDAPSILTTVQADGSLTAQWSPNDDGGAPVTGFQVRVVGPNGAQVGALRPAGPAATSLVLTGLTVGTAYRFQVVAENANGTSAFSALSAPAVFATKPAAPRNVSAQRGAGGAPFTATIRFRGPVNTGGVPLTGFRVWALNANGVVIQDAVTVAANARSFTFTFGTTAAVRLRVVADNAVGSSNAVTTATVNPR